MHAEVLLFRRLLFLLRRRPVEDRRLHNAPLRRGNVAENFSGAESFSAAFLAVGQRYDAYPGTSPCQADIWNRCVAEVFSAFFQLRRRPLRMGQCCR